MISEKKFITYDSSKSFLIHSKDKWVELFSRLSDIQMYILNYMTIEKNKIA